MNLLSNAIKFSDEGGSVALEAERRDRQIAVLVRDSGVGMTEAERCCHVNVDAIANERAIG